MDMHGAETWRVFRMTANTTTAQDVARSTRHGAERHWSLMGNRMLCRGVPLIHQSYGESGDYALHGSIAAMTNRTLKS